MYLVMYVCVPNLKFRRYANFVYFCFKFIWELYFLWQIIEGGSSTVLRNIFFLLGSLGGCFVISIDQSKNKQIYIFQTKLFNPSFDSTSNSCGYKAAGARWYECMCFMCTFCKLNSNL